MYYYLCLGSKVKFKMTEFGLEVISTVENEDGKPVEFSTSTSDKNLKKESPANDMGDEKKVEGIQSFEIISCKSSALTLFKRNYRCILWPHISKLCL